MSWSCYDPTPDRRHCGLCDSCRLRARGFAEAGLADPTVYATHALSQRQFPSRTPAVRGRAARSNRAAPGAIGASGTGIRVK